jgi:hypothetical protein
MFKTKFPAKTKGFATGTSLKSQPIYQILALIQSVKIISSPRLIYVRMFRIDPIVSKIVAYGTTAMLLLLKCLRQLFAYLIKINTGIKKLVTGAAHQLNSANG